MSLGEPLDPEACRLGSMVDSLLYSKIYFYIYLVLRIQQWTRHTQPSLRAQLALSTFFLSHVEKLKMFTSPKEGENHKLWFTVYVAESVNLCQFINNSRMITYFPLGPFLRKEAHVHSITPWGFMLGSNIGIICTVHLFLVWPTACCLNLISYYQLKLRRFHRKSESEAFLEKPKDLVILYFHSPWQVSWSHLASTPLTELVLSSSPRSLMRLVFLGH